MTEKLVIVAGPTATGKTALALKLAEKFDGEIIGADAYQIYRGMDIGTAKPTKEELGEITHHLLDVANPDEHFYAFRYQELADQAVSEVTERGKTPIVAGGTGLYIRSLVRGLANMPGADEELRASLAARAEKEGTEKLHEELTKVDPEYAERLGKNDFLRISRALEVHTLTGRTITEVHREHQAQPDRYQTLWIGLDPGQEILRERIQKRTDSMFAQGFIDEVRSLISAGYGPELPPMGALGYKSACQYIASEIDKDEAIRLTNRDTARYARRQRNWFRSEPNVNWFEGPDADVDDLIRNFL